MKTLASRLAAWYAGVFVGLLALVVVISSIALLFMLDQETHAMLMAPAADVRVLGTALGSNETALRLLAPAIATHIQRLGLRGAVFDNEGRFLAGDSDQAAAGAQYVAAKRGSMVPESGPLRYQPYPGGYLTYKPELGFLLFNLGPYWLTVGIVLLVALSVAVIAGRVLAAQALAPIVDVTNALDSLGRGDFSRRILVRDQSGEEIAALANAFNTAAEKVGAAFNERRKIEESMRQFSGDAGHELRTPLTVISGYISVLRRGAVTEPRVANDILNTISDECERMRRLIDKLLALARLDNPAPAELELVDAARLAHDAAEGARPLLLSGQLRLETNGPLQVRAHPAELRDAVRNLIENAAKHAPGADVEVAARRDDGRALIVVSDNGPGMATDERAHAFERFYRGEMRGGVSGSGLGLAIVKTSMERMGGEAELWSEPGKGTKVTLSLPLAEQERSPG
ncbi:MAG: HAMP domain-containing histidine kinase [Candidatus Eremiobacteraeota bacterium]|nr:HAMP domain-containing histidine kinase [Candidatus Eremiobacteraeota bacterium]MBV8366971.1 HAMP domain-containing histidine kinase [Candidatus Eremiobacteraeota bacterium]